MSPIISRAGFSFGFGRSRGGGGGVSLGAFGNPATSASAILAVNPTAESGPYWLNHGSGAYEAYCWMSGGGYILVAKIALSQSANWRWQGSNWSSTSPLNESNIANLSDNDSVGRGYYEYTLGTGFRMCLGTTPLSNYLSESKSGQNSKYFMTNTSNSDNGRDAFLNWGTGPGTPGDGGFISNMNSYQPYCNITKFSYDGGGHKGHYIHSGNNENDCNSNDSAIGFGCIASGVTFSAGAEATYQTRITRFSTGYIFAK